MERVRKIFALVIALSVTMELVFVPWDPQVQEVQAAEKITYGDYDYKDLDPIKGVEVIQIEEYTGTDEVVEVPYMIDGKRVVGIGSSAFEGCTSLKEITIPDTVTNIGFNAFRDCSNLTTITLPYDLTSIRSDAFSGCKKLTNITLPESLTDIESNAFSICTSLKEIRIPHGVTSIGIQAFYCCTGLAKITIPDNVTSIGSHAFEQCAELTEITISDSVTSIGDSAFLECNKLAKINYLGTAEQWNNLVNTTTGNDVLKTAVINYNYSYFDYESMDDGTIGITGYHGAGSNLVLDVPDKIDGKSVTGILDGAFQDFTELKEITIPGSVTDIGYGAFYGCTGLTRVNLSKSITKLYSDTFYGCIGLKEITISDEETSLVFVFTIPDKVTSIDDRVFYGCTGLTKIAIPGSVTSIGEDAFAGCTAFSEVYYSGTAEQWGKIVVNPTGNEKLLNAVIHCAGSDVLFQDYKYKLLDDGTIEIIKYMGTASNTAAEIPETIHGTKVTSIGSSAFAGLETLKDITIPVSVTSIKANAFSGCTQLNIIHYGATQQEWEKIKIDPTGNLPLLNAAAVPVGDYLYKYLDSESVEIKKYVGAASKTEAQIPEKINGISVTSIGTESFKDRVSLKKITIPSSVTRIKENAFSGCTGLSDIYYSGTKEQWGKIEIDQTVKEQLSKITIHYIGSVDDPYADYKYNILDDKTIEIKEYVGSDAIVNIPAKIEGKSVTVIGVLAFANCTSLKEVIIPDSVICIQQHAFSGCTGMETISIPESVESIEMLAFSNCTGLSEVKLPSSVKHIYIGAFKGCTGLEKMTIPSGVTTIVNSVFYGCTNLTEIKITGNITSIGYAAFKGCSSLAKINIPSSVTDIEIDAFEGCASLAGINIPSGVTNIDRYAFRDCVGLTEITIPFGVSIIEKGVFMGCKSLEKIVLPSSVKNVSVDGIEEDAFRDCTRLNDVYYTGSEEQWKKLKINTTGNEVLQKATIHYNYGTEPDIPDEPQIENVVTAKQALESLKAGDALSLEPAFRSYLSPEQIDIMESYLYTWLAEVNYAYKYSGNNGTKERIMKKAGIDPQGDFASGKEQAITHIAVGTKYGQKTFEVILNLGKPDSSGNLYPAYGAMHYDVIPKEDIPTDVPKTGQIGKSDYTDMGTFVQYVSKASEDSLHGTYQWQSLSDEMTAGILVDKTLAEIIGNKNGSFSDGTFTIYAKPLLTYSKKVTIACPVDVHVYTMDGKEAGSIVNNKKNEKDENVGLHVEGDKKTVYLTGNDYYLNLRGTDTGKMRYEVEEIANDKVCRDVQFLELQLKKDLQYEGYVFRPLNIDSDLYALRMVDGSSKETILSNKDSYETLFKKVQGLSLSHGNASLERNRSVQLSASLYPLDASNKSLQWTSDNQSVLSVDENGLVTAVGAGSATVTVSTRDGSFLKQYCVINVKGGSSNSGGGTSGGSGNSGSSGTNYGGTGNSGNSGNSGNNSGNSGNGSNGNTDNSKPGLEPEKPPVVTTLHYILQFQTNGGINLSRKTMTLLADDNPGIMPKIQRKGYVFDGWFTQQNGGEQVTGNQPLKAATTLYAHWSKAKAPKKLSAPTLKSKKKGQMKVTFKKVKGAAGYKLQYSAKRKFTSKKTKKLGATVKAHTISGLKGGKKYYARVRAYSTDSMGNKVYGKYSKVKSVKIKNET